MPGRLIVFEGIDGSGKSTQIELYFNYLKSKKIPARLISFPRYDQFYGSLSGRILRGELNGNQLSPYLFSLPFAADRLMAKDQINNWLKAGSTVLVDRYVWSSVAHQGAKDPAVIDWIIKMEYEINRLPKEDQVVYLNLPVDVSQKLMKSKSKDEAEKDVDYQKKVYVLYQQLAEKYHWQVIDCLDKQNHLLSKDDVSQKIAAAIG